MRSVHRRRLVVSPVTVSNHSHGFSLHELLVGLSVAAAATVVAAPLYGVVQSHHLTAEVNSLVGMLNLARSEAVKRSKQVVLCPTRDGERCAAPATDHTPWHFGYLLFVDDNEDSERGASETIIRVVQASERTRIVSARSRARVLYYPDGHAYGSNSTLTVCDPRRKVRPRSAIIANSGRVRVSHKPNEQRPCP